MINYTYNYKNNTIDSIAFTSNNRDVSSFKTKLKEEQSKYKKDSKYSKFKASKVVIYPFIYGWESGFKAIFLSEGVEVENNYFDEAKGKRVIKDLN